MKHPFIVCHMLTSIDGKIDGAFMRDPACANIRAEYGNLRSFYDCQATIYGTPTAAGSFADGRIEPADLPVVSAPLPHSDHVFDHDVYNYIVAVDRKGTLKWSNKYIEKKGRPRAHLIEVLTEQVSDAYLAYLNLLEISYIFAGETEIDCRVMVDKLQKLFKIEGIILAGGGLINWSMLSAGLVDELSIVVAPLTDGDTDSVSVFERIADMPKEIPKAFAIKEIKQIMDDGLWLRYVPKV